MIRRVIGAVWYGCLFSLLVTVCSCLMFPSAVASAEGKSVMKGRVVDAEDRAVEGTQVFVYTAPDVRKPADFISALTDRDGLFRIVLPPGKYWAVARMKKTGGFGPLLPGDRHSGEPREVELSAGQEVEMNFVVADLKDAIKMRMKDREGAVRIKGRIVNSSGEPVMNAYVIANRQRKISGIPDFLSAWADDEGHFTLYLTKGSYYIGSALAFPPGADYSEDRQITVGAENIEADVIRREADTR